MSNAVASFLSSPVRSARPKIATTHAMQNTSNNNNNLDSFSISPTQTHKYTKPKILPNHGAGFGSVDNAAGDGACKKMHREEGQRQARDFDDLMDLIHRTSLDCKKENTDWFPATTSKPGPLSSVKKEQLSLRLRGPERRPSSRAVRRTSQSSSNATSQASTTCTPTTANSLESSQEFSCATPSSRLKPSLTDHLVRIHGEKTPKSIVVKKRNLNLELKQRVTDRAQQPPNQASPRRRSKPRPVPKNLMISLEEELSDDSNKEQKKATTTTTTKSKKKSTRHHNDGFGDTIIVWRRENEPPISPTRKLSRRASSSRNVTKKATTLSSSTEHQQPKKSRRLSRRGSDAVVDNNAPTTNNTALHEWWMDNNSNCSSEGGVIIPDQAKIPFLSLSNSTDSLQSIVERSKQTSQRTPTPTTPTTTSSSNRKRRGVNPSLKNELTQYVKEQQHSKIMKNVVKKKLLDDIKQRTCTPATTTTNHPETKLAQVQLMEDITSWQWDQQQRPRRKQQQPRRTRGGAATRRPPTPPLSKRKLPISSTSAKKNVEQDENRHHTSQVQQQESASLDDLFSFPTSGGEDNWALGQTDVFGNSINDLSAFDDHETPDSMKWKSFR
jgi:hypothetical protein